MIGPKQLQFQGHLQDPESKSEAHHRGRIEGQAEAEKARTPPDKRDSMRENAKKVRTPHAEVEQTGTQTRTGISG